MEDKCKVCGRRLGESTDYCPYHERAYVNLSKAFELWRRALDIDWESFLREVLENPETGEWAKEVADRLVSGGITLGPAC